jgi:metallophosphoesterase (TIGR00282 family)
LRILFIGDVVGRVGRNTVRELLPGIRERLSVDLTIANGENAAGGIGLTEKTGRELLRSGIDVLTSGNHIWDKRDGRELVESWERLLRPANYPPGAPGRGAAVFTAADGSEVGVVNLQGRVFMQEIDCPFREGSRLVDELRTRTPIILVDVHAEATSEKAALAWHLAGRASAVIGTHTHVQTADEAILEGHTAFITDVGMTGPSDSVIGIRKDLSVARFVTQLPQRFEAAGGPGVLSGVLIDVDPLTGAARGIDRVLERTDAPSVGIEGAPDGTEGT